MKRINRYLCLVMAIIMLLAIPVHAQEASTWASAYITSYDSYLYKSSTNQIQVWFEVTGMGRVDELGVSEIRVQRSSTGTGDWVTMKTYYPEDYPELLSENAFVHTGYVTYTGTAGYYYRAIVTFYSKKGNGSGEIIDYAEVLRL